ncbi:hypothetical protein OCU04_011836 [Sclerotinia nivalis]|uniref:Uncharacterized protein n=1 Tax=Sclerotinia nivalis TaxID=352851 RepID=A0A9X0AAY9_9HELO|nr:hypothetical protein OCU04_011836 [Sclerotinia nivalis]
MFENSSKIQLTVNIPSDLFSQFGQSNKLVPPTQVPQHLAFLPLRQSNNCIQDTASHCKPLPANSRLLMPGASHPETTCFEKKPNGKTRIRNPGSVLKNDEC